jgi:hypothetical protein
MIIKIIMIKLDTKFKWNKMLKDKIKKSSSNSLKIKTNRNKKTIDQNW